MTSPCTPDRGGRACEGQSRPKPIQGPRRGSGTDSGEGSALKDLERTLRKTSSSRARSRAERLFLYSKKREDATHRNVMDRERIAKCHSGRAAAGAPATDPRRVSLTLVAA